MPIRSKRAYDPPSLDDGHRYLIDRLWPRGRSSVELALTDWLKELSPSDALRRWFGHDPALYPEFRRRYRAELGRHRNRLNALVAEARQGTVTLVFGARDAVHSNAAVLAELVNEELGRRGRARRDRSAGLSTRRVRRRSTRGSR